MFKPPFRDRIDSANKLVSALQSFKDDGKAIILALPRGGVPMGDVLSAALRVPLDIVVPRKIGHPDHAEYAIGALTETGEVTLDQHALSYYKMRPDDPRIRQIIEKEKLEAQRRLREYRGDRPPQNLSGRTVILVDDGVATGQTIKAAIKSVVKRGAAKVVVAAPVAPPETVEELRQLGADVRVLLTPQPLRAVGLWYAKFDQTEDAEVLKIMRAHAQDDVKFAATAADKEAAAAAATTPFKPAPPAADGAGMPSSGPIGGGFGSRVAMKSGEGGAAPEQQQHQQQQQQPRTQQPTPEQQSQQQQPRA